MQLCRATKFYFGLGWETPEGIPSSKKIDLPGASRHCHASNGDLCRVGQFVAHGCCFEECLCRIELARGSCPGFCKNSVQWRALPFARPQMVFFTVLSLAMPRRPGPPNFIAEYDR